MTSVMIQLLSILVLCGAAVHGNWESMLPWEAKTTLLQLSDQFHIHYIRDDPVPIYREDLPKDYIAYWYIPINKDEYIIISSSAKTGDYKLVIQGSGTSLVDELVRAAVAKNIQCSKYYMVTPTPDINLSCQDVKGHSIYPDNHVAFNKEDAHTLSKLWENQRNDVQREHVWEKSFLTKFDNATHFRLIARGDNHKLVIGDSKQAGITIMNGGDISQDEEQKMICKVLGFCHRDDNTVIDPRKFQKTSYGQTFLHVQIPHVHKQQEVYLTLSTIDKAQPKGQRIAIDARTRVKRQTGAWTYYGIADEYLFPDYNQHQHDCKKGWFWNRKKTICCAVGCGPVAWAMVLGYYDRRSHTKPGTYGTGSQGLYNCGADASTGSKSCKAPATTDNRVKRLTEKLNDQLGTFCLSKQGATTQGNMKKFLTYFKHRQTTGNPSVTVHSKGLLSFVGTYNDGIRNIAISYIKAKWPVVVGIRVSGIFSQHYPVATKYRKRSKKECKRGFLGLGKKKCKTVTEHEMYLHMGWGGSKNGWRPAKMFMAAVAKY